MQFFDARFGGFGKLSDTTLYDYYTSEQAATLSFTSYKTRGYRNDPRDNTLFG